MKYVATSLVVEAYQIGTPVLPAWLIVAQEKKQVYTKYGPDMSLTNSVVVETPAGAVVAYVGDYIIRNAAGELSVSPQTTFRTNFAIDSAEIVKIFNIVRTPTYILANTIETAEPHTVAAPAETAVLLTADIDAGTATATIYSDATYATTVASIVLTAGETVKAYIKVVSATEATVKYYKVDIVVPAAG